MARAARNLLVRKWTRSKRKHDACSSNGTRQLRDTVKDKLHGPNAAHKEEREADVRIEEPARRAEEEPGGA